MLFVYWLAATSQRSFRYLPFMIIVRASIDHLIPLVKLFEEYRLFYGKPPDEKSATQFLRERIIRNESRIFIALTGQAAVGFTQLYPSFTSVGLGRLWILNDLYVTVPSRGQGVANALMKAAEEFAQADGAVGLMLETQVSNVKAQHLYEQRRWKRSHDYYTYYYRF